MVLMVLGYYSTILAQVTGLLDSLLARDWRPWDLWAFLVPFGIGVVLGIFPIAKIIEWRCSKKFPQPDLCGDYRADRVEPVLPFCTRPARWRVQRGRPDRGPGAGRCGRLGHLADGRKRARLTVSR